MTFEKLFLVGIIVFFCFLLHTQQVFQGLLFNLNWSGSLMAPMTPPYHDPWSFGSDVGCDGIFSCARKFCQIYNQTNVTSVAVRFVSGWQNCSTLDSSSAAFEYVNGFTLGAASSWLSYIAAIFALSAFVLQPLTYKKFWLVVSQILIFFAVACSITAYSLWMAYQVNVYSLLGDTPPRFLIAYTFALNVTVIVWLVVNFFIVLAEDYCLHWSQRGYYRVN